uniref:Dynactin subunit 4 n=1 Tax=Panagrellus redivivus TaxID=6233 RepID=A0A7E4WB27_PANRE
MAALLQTNRVKYECSCGLPFPLDELYFCRQCVKLKCVECTQQFVDNIICQGCFETATAGENRERVGRCPSCYMCPICSTVLMSRSINNKFRLQCTYCRFNTLDAGIEDQVDNDKWKFPSSPNAEFFQNIRSKMLEYAEFDKFEHERNPDKRRRSTLFLSDKYGLNSLYNQRKKSGYADRPEPMKVEYTKMDNVEELSLDEIMAPVENPLDIHNFSEQLQSLSSTKDRWLPEALPVLPRRTVRCGESENSLVKAEYNPLSITFRMRYLAFTYVPDIRMYRPPVITILTQSYVLIYVSNYSNGHVTARVTAVDVDDDSFVSSALNKEVVVPLPPPNTIQDIEDQLQLEGNIPSQVDISKPFYENIIFKRRHQAALTIPVHAKKIVDRNFLKLRMEVEYDNLAPAIPDKSMSRTSIDRNYSSSFLSRSSSMADTTIPPTPTPSDTTLNTSGSADKPKISLSHPITIVIDIGRTIDDNLYDCDMDGKVPSLPTRIPAEDVFA